MIKIAYFLDDGSYYIHDQVLIKNTSETRITYNASLGVRAILLNVDHEDFVKVNIDSTSYNYFQQKINLIRGM